MEDRSRLAPSGTAPRGQSSTIAQEFAAEMDSFLKPDTNTLAQTVEEKKSIVTSAEQELEELERRLKETEQRLQKVSRQSSPNRQAQEEALAGAQNQAPGQGQGQAQVRANTAALRDRGIQQQQQQQQWQDVSR